MNQCKKSSTNLTCVVCKIDFNSNADFALHEFSKKHCDNLIRVAKHKPIISKKPKTEVPQVPKEPPKVNSVPHTGSFAKYGYFVPGEIYVNPEISREFNTDYDPYLQKFAENPYKEKPNLPVPTETATFSSVTSFSKKKKKKKIKTCTVCNVTLSTVPEYEAHMKSPQHIWKLKVTGMGVSAHFVKASSDLHTTDISEDSKDSHQMEEKVCNEKITTTTTNNEDSISGPFPLLYCSDCELLLNSPQQYNAHISGKAHLECAQRKAELKVKKEKSENPSPDQLYCYSCKISLNNLFQYNEHKNGKKHKTKCRNLIRRGITIPPEERVPGIPLPNPNKPVVYPESYVKLVLEKPKESDSNSPTLKYNANVTVEAQPYTENNLQYSSFLTNQNLSAEHSEKSVKIENTRNCASEAVKTPKIIFHKKPTDSSGIVPDLNLVEEVANSKVQVTKDTKCSNSVISEEPKKQVTIITDGSLIKCNICNESFQWQTHFDVHLGTENHLLKILECKLSGSTESSIVSMLFSDRDVIKPNCSGKLTCSVCNVTADNAVEFDQHLNSMVHKYTHKDYRTKRSLEVKHILPANDDGLFFCKLCKEGWSSLLDFIQHLHTVKHKTTQRELARKRTSSIRKSRHASTLKKKNLPLRRVKTEKNPGVRTKVCGMAVDLDSGIQAPVPNLEPLEPKIDTTKNVNIRVPANVNEDATPKIKSMKKCGVLRTNWTAFHNHQRSRPYHDDRPPFAGNSIPPLMAGPPFHLRFPRPNHANFNRNWQPYSGTAVFGPICGRRQTPPISSYIRPSWPPTPSWRRYR